MRSVAISLLLLLRASLRNRAALQLEILPPAGGPIVATPLVGGLHHRFDRRAA
jgi:hypothetical protein